MRSDRGRHAEEYVWTDEDFDVMGWHDVKARAVALEPSDGTFESLSQVGYYPLQLGGRLLLDLDYIVEWVRPTPPEREFGYWISPATLVFENVQRIQGGELDLVPCNLWLEIEDLNRSKPHPSGVYEWTLGGHDFTLTFSATGFRQYLRQPPVFSNSMYLSLAARGGISFLEQGATEVGD